MHERHDEQNKTNQLFSDGRACLRAQVTFVDLILAFESPADLVSCAVDNGGINNELLAPPRLNVQSDCWTDGLSNGMLHRRRAERFMG